MGLGHEKWIAKCCRRSKSRLQSEKVVNHWPTETIVVCSSSAEDFPGKTWDDDDAAVAAAAAAASGVNQIICSDPVTAFSRVGTSDSESDREGGKGRLCEMVTLLQLVALTGESLSLSLSFFLSFFVCRYLKRGWPAVVWSHRSLSFYVVLHSSMARLWIRTETLP